MSSQAQTIDAHLWTGVGLAVKVNKKLSIGYETQTRFKNNASTLGTYLNQIGGSYKVTKDLNVGLDYRFSRKRKDYYYLNDNRLMMNVAYGYKLKPIGIKLKARARYQHSFDRLSTINETITPNFSNVLRLKLTAKYKYDDFKRIQPFISYEYYKSLDPEPIQFTANAYRLSGGLFFDLPFKNELKLYYIYEVENKSTPEVNHIYSIQYTYNLDKLFSK